MWNHVVRFYVHRYSHTKSLQRSPWPSEAAIVAFSPPDRLPYVWPLIFFSLHMHICFVHLELNIRRPTDAVLESLPCSAVYNAWAAAEGNVPAPVLLRCRTKRGRKR